MVNNVTPDLPAVGGCLRCRQLFLVTDSSSSCQFCGRPPDRFLSFGPLEPVAAEPKLPAEEWAEEQLLGIPFDFTCPECGEEYQVRVTDSEISVVPPSHAPPAEEAAATEAPLPAAAPQPADTPPPPAMARDVFDNPIEGPSVPPAPLESTTEASPGFVGEGQAAAAPTGAPEEPPI